jgi:hypothetical protein
MTTASTVNVRVPADLAPFFQKIADHLAEFSASSLLTTPDFAAGEKGLLKLMGGLESASLGSMLQSLDPTTPYIEVGGVQYKRLEQRAENTYYTMRDEVVVNRHLYRSVDVRNGPTVVPLDLRAGIVDGRYTPAAAVGFARLAQAMPSREAEATCESLGVLPFSRSSHFRVGDEVGSRWEDVRHGIEADLATDMDLPAAAAAISVAVDRVSMPMAEPREPTIEDIEAGIKKPIAVNFRMAFSAVWTLYDKEGTPLLAVRYAHVPTDGAADIVRSLSRDLNAVLARRPDLNLVTLADGAPEMQSMLDAVVAGHAVTARFVDFWHCIEHLAKAIVDASPCVVEDHLSDWKHLLLERDDAIDLIEVDLREWAMQYMLRPIETMPKGLHDAFTYVLNHRERLRYATHHKACLPIGSGSVEATGKTIVEVRMKRAGCRWTEPGAQALLGLRALATSEPKRWRAAMIHILASYKHNVTMLPARDATALV